MRSVQYRFGAFRLISGTRQVWRDGQPVRLPPRVFDCVVYLLENRERAIGRDELVAALWGRIDVADTQLSQLVRRVRHALGDDGQSQQTIATVPGFGYRWAMPAEAEPVAPGPAPPPVTATPPASIDMPIDAPAAVPPARRRVAPAALALALAAIAVAAMLALGRRPPAADPAATTTGRRVIVLPLEVTAPADAAWVRLGAMDVVADRLRTSGLVVPPSESVLAMLQGTGAAASRAQALFDTGLVVHGRADKSPDGWRIALQTQPDGDVRRTAEAADADPVRAAHAAADRLAAALGHAPANDPDEHETFDARIARVRAALLADEVAVARTLLADAGLPGEDSTAIRYWRAKVDFRAGDLDQAQRDFDALLADPSVRADAALHGRVLIARAGVGIRRAEYADADRDFDTAVGVLKGLDASPEYAEALAGRGIARVALRRFADAAADLGHARLQMERAGDAFGATRVDANLGLFELVRRRPAAALPYLHAAADRFAAYGAISPLLSTLNAQFDAYADLLRWSDAFAVGERRLALRDRAADPMQHYLIGVDHSRALAALGRQREAGRALDEVEQAYPTMRATIRQVLYAQRAELAWRQGQPQAALAAARRGLDTAPCTDASTPCGTLGLVYQRALVATGTIDAEPLAPALRHLPDAPAAIAQSPAAAVTQAEWDARRGAPAAAQAGFEAALAGAERDGAPRDVALVADAYARWLLERGQNDRAAAVAGRVAAWADRDFDCALLQVAVLRAYGRTAPWAAAVQRARVLAGERPIPDAPAAPPS